MALTRVILIHIEAPLIAFVWTGLVEFGLGAIGLLVAYRLCGNHTRLWHRSLLRGRDLLKSSWLLMLSGLVIMIYVRIDQIMLGQMVDNQAVGIYAAAVRLAEIWYFVPIAFTSSFFSTLVKIRKYDQDLYQKRLQKLFSLKALRAAPRLHSFAT